MTSFVAVINRPGTPDDASAAESLMAGVFTTAINTTLGLYGPDGACTYSTILPLVPGVSAGDHFDGVISTLVSKVGGRRLAGIGIAVAGDVQGGAIVRAGRLAPWREFNVTNFFAKRIIGVPIAVENNAVARSLFEARRNPSAATSTLYLHFGVGVNGVIVNSGDLTWRSLELGHMAVDPIFGHRDCSCGNKNCLEAYVGESAVTKVLNANGGTHRMGPNDWSRIADPLVGLLRRQARDHQIGAVRIGGRLLELHRGLKDAIEEMLTPVLGVPELCAPLPVASDAAVELLQPTRMN